VFDVTAKGGTIVLHNRWLDLGAGEAKVELERAGQTWKGRDKAERAGHVRLSKQIVDKTFHFCYSAA